MSWILGILGLKNRDDLCVQCERHIKVSGYRFCRPCMNHWRRR